RPRADRYHERCPCPHRPAGIPGRNPAGSPADKGRPSHAAVCQSPCGYVFSQCMSKPSAFPSLVTCLSGCPDGEARKCLQDLVLLTRLEWIRCNLLEAATEKGRWHSGHQPSI